MSTDTTDKLSTSGKFRVFQQALAEEMDANETVLIKFMMYGGTAAFLLWAYIGLSILTLPSYIT